MAESAQCHMRSGETRIFASLVAFEADLEKALEVGNAARVRKVAPAIDKYVSEFEESLSFFGNADEIEILGYEISVAGSGLNVGVHVSSSCFAEERAGLTALGGEGALRQARDPELFESHATKVDRGSGRRGRKLGQRGHA